MRSELRTLVVANSVLILAFSAASCAREEDAQSEGGELVGAVAIDGSSTVLPIAEAVASVIAGSVGVREAVADLLARPVRAEN